MWLRCSAPLLIPTPNCKGDKLDTGANLRAKIVLAMRVQTLAMAMGRTPPVGLLIGNSSDEFQDAEHAEPFTSLFIKSNIRPFKIFD